MKKKRFSLTSTHYILFSFLIAILVGSVFLMLPISSTTGEMTPFIDALFTATTSTCVTGLVTVPTVSHWSVFGQIIILILIQIGGLGIITIMASIVAFMHKKMGLADRVLLQDAFNLNTLSGLEEFVRKVIKGTFLIEGLGALCYMIVFVPKFGLKGVWISVFTSVSAFCNAGIDIFAENSLCDYALNPIINFTTAVLIILGGVGYIVWWDVLRVIRERKKGNLFRRLTLHSKIAISVTGILLAIGTISVLIFEYSNPNTIGDFSLLEKIEVSFFQSVTTRTAGFASVPQENLTDTTALICMILMFIGGSPVGTAGGVKTVTLAVLIVAAIATIRNKKEVNIFGRSLTRETVSKAAAVVGMSFVIMLSSTILLSAVTNAGLIDILYETVSATATVGLTRNLTGNLNTYGKWIIIATMYLGRVGPISLAVAFNFKKEKSNIIKNPVEDISVG